MDKFQGKMQIERSGVAWTLKWKTGFNKLKELCTLASILAYAEFKKPLKLLMDACGLVLSAICTKRKMIKIGV